MLKRIAIGLAVLVVLALGAVWWLWSQATALPDWYEPGDPGQYAGAPGESEGDAAPPQWVAMDPAGHVVEDEEPVPLEAEWPEEMGPEAAAAPERPETKTKRKRRKSKARRHELRGFHRQPVRKPKDGTPAKPDPGRKAIKASRAVYEDGHLTIGLILDLSDFPRDKLTEKDRARFDRAVENFPGLTKRDVWVGVEDDPVTVGGYLQLSDDAEVRVGKLTYSMAGAAKRLGMTPTTLRKSINRDLRRIGLVDPNDPPPPAAPKD